MRVAVEGVDRAVTEESAQDRARERAVAPDVFLVVEEADRVGPPNGQGRLAEDAQGQRRVVLGAHQIGQPGVALGQQSQGLGNQSMSTHVHWSARDGPCDTGAVRPPEGRPRVTPVARNPVRHRCPVPPSAGGPPP